MTKRQEEFLTKLADLCEKYDAEFSYTTDDDGIHITMDDEEIYVGFLFHPVAELRKTIRNQ